MAIKKVLYISTKLHGWTLAIRWLTVIPEHSLRESYLSADIQSQATGHFYKDDFGIKYPTKFDMPSNQRTKTNHWLPYGLNIHVLRRIKRIFRFLINWVFFGIGYYSLLFTLRTSSRSLVKSREVTWYLHFIITYWKGFLRWCNGWQSRLEIFMREFESHWVHCSCSPVTHWPTTV